MNVSPAPERIQQLARDERLARRAGFWWGFAEGLFFFIVPDVYVSYAALYSLRAGLVSWVASIAGSLTSVVVLYLLVVVLGADYVAFLDAIPGIPSGMLFHVGQQLGANGLSYTPLLILSGVPLKVYVGIAFFLGIGLVPVLLWTVFARIVRIAPTYIMAAAGRLIFRRSIDARPGAWFALLSAVWCVFYAFYFFVMSRRVWF
jgi:hypothetical protein